MKLLVRDYLASLKERGELDAVLPDLLSELGFHVYSRPTVGTTQRGVDVAAVSPASRGERRVHLFSIKQGDLTRRDWNDGLQALRPSLDEIRDGYIPTRIPREYQDLKIVICPCFGGTVHEGIWDLVTGYTSQNSTAQISYEIWDGDRLAGLLLEGALRQEVLPPAMRSRFQKAVAMVDEPDVAYRHFMQLANQLREAAGDKPVARVRAARQLHLCLWILYVWARDAGNLEAPYRLSELVTLRVWDLLRPTLGRKTKAQKDLTLVFNHAVQLHHRIGEEFLLAKIFPHADTRHGLSSLGHARTSVDVNLALFEILGRIGQMGLWLHWMSDRLEGAPLAAARLAVDTYAERGLALIATNPALRLPIADHQATDIAVFLLLTAATGKRQPAVVAWLTEMAGALDFAVRTRNRYPASFTTYRELAAHPRDRSDVYFKEAMAGSTLIPLLAAWLRAVAGPAAIKSLTELVAEELEDCTLQTWMPDAASEEHFYLNDAVHGRALTDLIPSGDGSELIEVLTRATTDDKALMALTALSHGAWPMVLVACRHHRLPVPPGLWAHIVSEQESPES